MQSSAVVVPTRESLAFLTRHLGDAPRRVLEVGCGLGDLAAGLVERGHEVLALDSDPSAVERARERGLDVRLARFPEEAGDLAAFDAIVLGRVLHHLPEIDPAVAALHEHTVSGGLVLVEDYAWERVDPPTAEWVRELLLDIASRGGKPQEDWDLEGDAFDAWLANTRDEGLSSSGAMAEALGQHFALEHVEDVAYAYRWCARYLPDAPAASEAALAAERSAILSGAIVPIGWRAVARRP